MPNEDFIERVAALHHDQWAGWAQWMLQMIDRTTPTGETYRDRWKRQIATPYAELSDEEKASDRRAAKQMIALLERALEDALKGNVLSA